MFLIDTSVWIDYLRQRPTRPMTWFEEILDRDYPFGITGVIYQEVLQGADSKASYQRLEEYLSTQVFYHPRDPVESHAEAARLYFRCRRAGVTLRSTIDCLIAQVALEHDLLIVHNDRDFDLMASVIPDIRLYSSGLTKPQPDTIHEPVVPYGTGEPPVSSDSRYTQDELRDSVVIKGDIIEPVLPAEAWEAIGEPGD